MGSSFGRTVNETTGNPVQVTADGSPHWKAGGVTLDWSAVTAVDSDTTLSDGTVVKAGDKYILYGTVLVNTGSATEYVPADSDDGSDGLVHGETFILNQTVVESNPGSDHPAVIQGGLVWADRLQVGGSGEPTLDQLLAAMPTLELVKD